MCIIIAKKRGVEYGDISESIRESAYFNSDGGGFALKRDGEQIIMLDKGFFDAEVLIKKLETLKIKENDELMIHLRFATHGPANMRNCHPFVVHHDREEARLISGMVEDMVVTHNGVLNKYTFDTDVVSDTCNFVTKLMGNKHVKNMVRETPETFEDLFEDSIEGDKLAIMYPDKEMYLVNEHKFIEENGVRTKFL